QRSGTGWAGSAQGGWLHRGEQDGWIGARPAPGNRAGGRERPVLRSVAEGGQVAAPAVDGQTGSSLLQQVAGGEVRMLALERLPHSRTEQIGKRREAEGEGGDVAGRTERQ